MLLIFKQISFYYIELTLIYDCLRDKINGFSGNQQQEILFIYS